MPVEINPIKRFDPVRRLNALIDLNVSSNFEGQFKEQVLEGEPFVIYTHEAQVDGIGAAVVGERLMQLSQEAGRVPQLRGYVMPVARSLFEGQQSRKLQIAFHIFNVLVSRKGLKTFPYTREKDEKEFGMNRQHLVSELRPLVTRIKQGYAAATFASGSVEAGRHDEGRDPEEIHGLQRLTGTDILTLSRVVRSANRERRMFFVIIGLHGGFRLQSPNKGKLYPTNEGLASFLGWPENFPPHIRHVKMEANLGTIITDGQMADRFGRDWVTAGKDKSIESIGRVQSINDYIMGHAALLLPPHARGAYSHLAA